MSKKAEMLEEAAGETAGKRCGIVMPISAIDGCDEAHWEQVLSIIGDAVTTAGYEPNLVSASDEIGVIHKRIVQNLYANPIVICDVSGKNPNVMLELGLRLAFDKPVIIIKDDQTAYSFDTSAIEHLSYPRDLRYPSIVRFKEDLARKIEATVKAANSGNHTTFLGHFGKFKVAKIETEVVSAENYILAQLQEIKDELRSNKSSFGHEPRERMTAGDVAAMAHNILVKNLGDKKIISDPVIEKSRDELFEVYTMNDRSVPPSIRRRRVSDAIRTAIDSLEATLTAGE